MTTTDRTLLIDYAKICQLAGLYEEMIIYTRQLAVSEESCMCSLEEIELVIQSYKHYISPRRKAWKYFLRELDKQRSIGNERFAILIRDEKDIVEFEIVSICLEFIEILKNLVIHQDKEIKTPRILLLKNIGDYSKYLAEVYMSRGNDGRSLLIEVSEQGKKAYEEAIEIMKDIQDQRLILAVQLNWSVYVYEVLKRQKEACIIARDAFQNGSRNSTKDKEILDLLQILHNNLVLWTTCVKN